MLGGIEDRRRRGRQRMKWLDGITDTMDMGLGGGFQTRQAPLVAQTVKNPHAMQETQVRSLGREDPLEKEMATHSSTLAWKIPWTEKPVESLGSQRVRHD